MPDTVWIAETLVCVYMKDLVGLMDYLIPIAHEVMQRDKSLIHHHPVGVEGPLYQEVSQGRDGDIRLVCTLKQIWRHDDNVNLVWPGFTWDLQSRCFFLGPMISSVVALHTALARPWPARLCRAARILSLRVCPPGVCILVWEISEFPHWSETEHCLLVDDREGAAQSTGSGALFCVVCVNCVMGHCAAWSLLLLTLLVAGELS